MPIDRTVLLGFPSIASAQFTVERWFLPMDHQIESVTRTALVWHTDDHEYVALLNRSAISQLLRTLHG